MGIAGCVRSHLGKSCRCDSRYWPVLEASRYGKVLTPTSLSQGVRLPRSQSLLTSTGPERGLFAFCILTYARASWYVDRAVR
jgi:hypothetical protein